MSAPGARHPASKAWAAAILNSENPTGALGTAVAIDSQRLLTSAHVVADRWPGQRLWVEFSSADGVPVRQVAEVKTSAAPYDLALLRLSEPAPAEVAPVTLSFLEPSALPGHEWAAFGFPLGNRLGGSADGVFEAVLAHGFVRLKTESLYRLQDGFSGSGLWSPGHAAVVAIVTAADTDNGDGQAVTLHQADRCFPEEELRALSIPPGWALEEDPESSRHWLPRARGVNVNDDRVYRFRGREAALKAIIGWLDREHPDHRALVVTGSPGVGKSAVLSNVIATAAPADRVRLPDDGTIRAREGSVACAVHAKDKTALAVAAEIAKAAGTSGPEEPYNLAPMIRTQLTDRQATRFNIIIDAVDEASSAGEAQAIIKQVVLPLLNVCAEVGVQVVVGARRRVGDRSLPYLFNDAVSVIDLDEPDYFALADLEEYVLATLQLLGAERRGNPYDDERVARPLAKRIAELSGQNFLIAGMTALSHGLNDETPIDPGALGYPGNVGEVLRAYLTRVPGQGEVPAAELLTALAFAESPGLSFDLWARAVEALTDVRPTPRQLGRFVKQAAANFLIESSDQNEKEVYRLFHEAIDEALLAERAEEFPYTRDQQALTRTFLDAGRQRGWAATSLYLLRSLPYHAEQGGMLDELITDDDYLLHAEDLRRLTQLADKVFLNSPRQVSDIRAQDRARLLARTPYARTAAAPTRHAMFSVTEALEKLGDGFRTHGGSAPYLARWATTSTHPERAEQEGHSGGVWAVHPLNVHGRTLIASCGEDEMVRIWDPVDGRQLWVLEGHAGSVFDLAYYVDADGRTLLASGGADAMVRIWDPAVEQQVRVLEGHAGSVYGVVTFEASDGRTLLATSGADDAVRVWDPASGEQLRELPGHGNGARSVCAFTLGGQALLASCGPEGVRTWDAETGQPFRELENGTVAGWSVFAFVGDDGRPMLASSGENVIRLWDPESGRLLRVLEGHTGGVWAVCSFVESDGHTVLASVGDDEMTRIWDPSTGVQRDVVDGNYGGGYAVCAYTLAGRTLLASGGAASLMAWDPATGESQPALRSGTGAAWSLSPFRLDGRALLASSAGVDAVVRLWEPVTGTELGVLKGHTGAVWSVCTFAAPNGRDLLASAGAEGVVRIWDPASRTQLLAIPSGTGALWSTCAFVAGGRTMIAAAGTEGIIRLWDPSSGSLVHALHGHVGTIWWMRPFELDGRTLLVSAGNDGTLMIWDPVTGEPFRALAGHPGGVWCLCTLTLAGRPLVASGGCDLAVRIWDPATGAEILRLEGHTGGVWSVCAITGPDGRILLASSSDDTDVRVWDPATGACLQTIPVHILPLELETVEGLLIAGLSTGLLAIQLT